VAAARQQWLDEEGDVVDDCTLILAFLDVAPAPAPAPGAHADAGHGRRSVAAHPPAAARRASQHSQGCAEPAHAPTASATVRVAAAAPPHGGGGGGGAAPGPGLAQGKPPAAHRAPPHGASLGHAETAASPSGAPLGAAGRAPEAGAAPHAHAKRSQRLSM
jgi:hypothetical protein